MIIVATMSANVNIQETLPLGFASSVYADILNNTYNFGNGTGASQIDLHWELASVTLASGASVTYTLSALVDSIGRTVALAKVTTFLIKVITRTAGDFLTIGGAASHPWNGFPNGLTVYDLLEDIVFLTDARVVGAGTNDQVKILNSGANSITFAIAFAGRSV